MKISYSGQSCLSSVMLSSLGRLRRFHPLLLRPGAGRLAHPAALVMRAPACLEALAVAGAVAGEHLLEFAPVDLAEAVMACGFIPAQRRVGDFQPDEVRLRDGGVDEFLAQLIIRETLDLP